MPRDLTVSDFMAAMKRHGFALSGGTPPRCRDLWHGGVLDTAVTPIIVRRRLQRQATLDACLKAREAARDKRRLEAAKITARLEFAARIAPTEPTPVRSELTGEAAIDRMADDMAEISAARGNCDRDDLALRGWDYAQLDTFGARARAAAQARQQRVAA